MLERIVTGEKRACVFTGPVLTPEDPTYQAPNEDPIQIPAGFWKIMVVSDLGQIKSAAFLVWQRDYDSDVPLAFSPILEQVRVTTIEMITGLNFQVLAKIDAVLLAERERSEQLSTMRIPSDFSDMETAGGPPVASVRSSSSAIFSPDDIVL